MTQSIVHHLFTDEQGNPAGGITSAQGLTVAWQQGPLGREHDRREPNGAFVETVITAALLRLSDYQSSPFKCDENAVAERHLLLALEALRARTTKREERGVEGTHEV